MGQDYDWQIAVFCHNEETRIGHCLAAIDKAVLFARKRALVTIIVNGSTDSSTRNLTAAAQNMTTATIVKRLHMADKSNAINHFLYLSRVSADTYFCIDGYVLIEPDALSHLAMALLLNPDGMVASGRALNGRTMATATKGFLQNGGVVGCLYALRPDFTDRMVQAGLRLPVGLYRGDGLIGLLARHDLDAIGTPEQKIRALGVPEAGFNLHSLSIFSLADLKRQFRRKVRQMRGLLENIAIKAIIYHAGFAGLPEYADDMITEYLASNPVPNVSWTNRPFMALALRQLQGTYPGWKRTEIIRQLS